LHEYQKKGLTEKAIRKLLILKGTTNPLLRNVGAGSKSESLVFAKIVGFGLFAKGCQEEKRQLGCRTPKRKSGSPAAAFFIRSHFYLKK